jgi:hypothetical protein
MLRVLSAVALAAAIAGSVGACQSTGGVALKVGDCVNYTNAVDADGGSIESTVVVDCAQPHAEEVFSVFDYPEASAFPGYEAIGALQQIRCQADFASYVGIAWEQSSYAIGYSAPSADRWAQGDHYIACLLEDDSGGQLTGSARGSAR